MKSHSHHSVCPRRWQNRSSLRRPTFKMDYRQTCIGQAMTFNSKKIASFKAAGTGANKIHYIEESNNLRNSHIFLIKINL